MTKQISARLLTIATILLTLSGWASTLSAACQTSGTCTFKDKYGVTIGTGACKGTNGNDIMLCTSTTASPCGINAKHGNDTIIISTASTANSCVFGDFGDDTIVGGPKNDTLDGGRGFDNIKAGAGNDIIIGGEDSDTLYGEAGLDSINAGTGNDSLYGGTENDILNGGDGEDTIDGGPGSDKCSPASLDDTIVRVSPTSPTPTTCELPL